MIVWPRKSSDSRVSFWRNLLFKSLSSSHTLTLIRSEELWHSLQGENVYMLDIFSIRCINIKDVLCTISFFIRTWIKTLSGMSNLKSYNIETKLRALLTCPRNINATLGTDSILWGSWTRVSRILDIWLLILNVLTSTKLPEWNFCITIQIMSQM